MSEPVTQIHISSNLLRSPHLFDGLGPPDKPGEEKTRVGRRKYGAGTGGICRDLVLFAAWNNQPIAELRLPDFCKMMGYDSSNLTRRCTDEEVEEIRRTGWEEDEIPAFSNVLGLALVRLVSHNFIFPDRRGNSKHKRFSGSKIVEHIDVFEAKSTGTLLTFTLSTEILEQNRRVFQTPLLEEYLSLRTKGKKGQDGKPDHPGHPDDAARRMYLRLTWKRQYWDHLMREERYEEAKAFLQESANEYNELVQVAGLADRRAYKPEKYIAAELRKLLVRVGSIASIQLEPEVSMKRGIYEVKWTHRALTDVSKHVPARSKYVCKPAPADWGAAPAAGIAKPSRTKLKSTQPVATKPTPKVAAPSTATKATDQATRAKLRDALEDKAKTLRWLESDAAKQAKAYADNPAALQQAREEALADLQALQQLVTA
jgi:hypothetical protein